MHEFSTQELDELLSAIDREPDESMAMENWRDADRVWGELQNQPGFQQRFGDTLIWPVEDEDADEALVTVDVSHRLRLASLCQDGRWMQTMKDEPAVLVLRELTDRIGQLRAVLFADLRCSADAISEVDAPASGTGDAQVRRDV